MEKSKDEYIIPIGLNQNKNTNPKSPIKYKPLTRPTKINIPLITNEETNTLRSNNSKLSDSGHSEAYYSVQSEIILEVIQTDDKNLKNKIIDIKPEHVVDTNKHTVKIEKDSIDYELEKEYKEMKEFFIEKQYDKIRELDEKILQKEILKRKKENKERLENLKKIEQKLLEENNRMVMSESQFQFKTGGNPELVNSLYIPNVLNTNKKVDLVLANVEKGGGYQVIRQDEFNLNYEAVPFGGFVFYQKKES